MISLKIALVAFILGLASLWGVNIFDEMEWEGVATVCAFIFVVCFMFFICGLIMWIWNL